MILYSPINLFSRHLSLFYHLVLLAGLESLPSFIFDYFFLSLYFDWGL